VNKKLCWASANLLGAVDRLLVVVQRNQLCKSIAALKACAFCRICVDLLLCWRGNPGN
jgi:hypothetical protein